jgi:hypothetical protein
MKQLAANKLVPNLDKKNVMKFIMNNSPHSALHISYKVMYTEEMVDTKFLGLKIDKCQNWKKHIEQVIPKSSAACYTGRWMFHISNIITLKSAYFHFVIKYGVFFGVIFPIVEDIHFTKENQHYGWCMTQTLLIPCQYIFSLLYFIVGNQENFQTQSSIHNINTRNEHFLNRQNSSLSCFQKKCFCAGVGIFGSVPCSLTILKNEKAKFKIALIKYLNAHSFYCVGEFSVCKDDP